MPGGGHKLLVWTNEGTKVATALNRMGVTAFVLKYRLANEPGSPYSVEGDAADDARRAIRWVRAHAADYGIDPARVGAMGFSAGGELVSLIADNPDPAGRPAVDAIDRLSAPPRLPGARLPRPARHSGQGDRQRAARLPRRRQPRRLLRRALRRACTNSCEKPACRRSCTCTRTAITPSISTSRRSHLDPALARSAVRLARGRRLALAPAPCRRQMTHTDIDHQGERT